eukprot:7888182-Alexandrium_andersonii.AAC.1
MSPGIRRLNCAGPGMTSKSLPEALGGLTKRPGGRTGGAFAELLEPPTLKVQSCLTSRLRNSGIA